MKAYFSTKGIDFEQLNESNGAKVELMLRSPGFARCYSMLLRQLDKQTALMKGGESYRTHIDISAWTRKPGEKSEQVLLQDNVRTRDDLLSFIARTYRHGNKVKCLLFKQVHHQIEFTHL